MLSAVRCLKNKLFLTKDTILWKVFEETITHYAFQQFRIYIGRSISLRSQIDFTTPNLNSKHFGISFLRYMVAKAWDKVPNDMKNVNDMEIFKKNIGKWKPVKCNCKLCLQSFSKYFEALWCFTKFSFHHKSNDARLLLINMVYMSCLMSCRTT